MSALGISGFSECCDLEALDTQGLKFAQGSHYRMTQKSELIGDEVKQLEDRENERDP